MPITVLNTSYAIAATEENGRLDLAAGKLQGKCVKALNHPSAGIDHLLNRAGGVSRS